MSPSARTRFLGMIGWPVAHSHSPPMQNAGLAALDLDWVYGAFAVEPERLAAAVAGARSLGLIGLNVTLPHKVAVLSMCVPDETAERVGAVNTLLFEDNGRPLAVPRGLNTDVIGFRMLLAEAGFSVRGKRAAVLGAGGAARAVVTALLDEGAAVEVVSRSGRKLGLPGRALGDPPHHPWSEESLGLLLPTVSLLVDTTPRGLDDRGEAIAEVELLPKDAMVADVVVHASTPLVAAARARGLRAATGEAMLLHQGAAALTAWTGRPAPIETMRDALARSMARTG